MHTRTAGLKTITGLSLTALALSACGGSAGDNGDAADEDTHITAAMAYETDNYHPSSTTSALAHSANWHVVEGLYELDMTNAEPYAALAADEELEEISETEYQVTLREDAAFSDGTPVTADDVVASFERTMDPENIYAPMLDFIDEVTAEDEQTVTISLNHPFTLIKERLPLVKIVPEDATDEDLTAQPIGSGPWKYDSISQDSIEFSPNEEYTGNRPAEAGSMEFQIILDDTARITALQEGTVQAVESVPQDMTEIVTGAGAEIESVQGFNLPFLMFNTGQEPFDDPQVRQAFFYAVNTEQLIDNALDGTASPATSFLPEDHPNYNEASTVYDHDPEEAERLLEEAGVEDLSITLLTTDHPWITDLAPQIMNDLQEIGVDVSLQEEASASLYANHTDVDDPTYDVALAPGDPSIFGSDPDLLMNWWYGDNIWTSSRSQWAESEAFDDLHEILDEAVEADEDEQQQLWNDAFDLVSEEVPIYPLFHREVITGYDSETLEGFSPIGTTGLSFLETASEDEGEAGDGEDADDSDSADDTGNDTEEDTEDDSEEE
ncbi:ABC transporter substrate-binding protein [Nesterenkonia aerolata]|uniref:ABC transporter substrate-binding protein n=1 Tax=Nesterenkonia aerolata TaxID=3074079 RepID=A0ABU2DTU2_9MICC|nr:ABC transporter substrate-binding protein [Nesterenkonia sp. LY-0111]MDR8019908.1 ABC transporter substrate-binding protein [Nesterenkonia sp. LY-0111]